jgi:hypothetical protein
MMADRREAKNCGGESLRRDFRRRAERVDASEEIEGEEEEEEVEGEEVSSAVLVVVIDDMSNFDDRTDGI